MIILAGCLFILYHTWLNLKMLLYKYVGTGHFPMRTFPHPIKYGWGDISPFQYGELSVRADISPWTFLARRTIPQSDNIRNI